jgi:hypothetical protein
MTAAATEKLAEQLNAASWPMTKDENLRTG